MPFVELIELLGRTLPLYVQRLDLLMIVGVVLLMIYTQYQRAAFVERRLFGFVKNQPKEQLLRALLYGVLGGVLATFIFIVLGISLNEVGIWYLWLLAVLLMFVHPRFLCFSYAGGILALSHLVLGFPRLDVAAVMALVAVLHLVEAVLIYVSGAEGASPVYVRNDAGEIVGGFTLQRFWPLPFVALVSALISPDMLAAAESVDMPLWWPIIRPAATPPPGSEYAFALFPVIAAVGYSDIALTRLPEAKAKVTARYLLGYSIGLLILAVLSQTHAVFAFAAALFSPLAHEWVIRKGRSLEARGPSLFSGHETMVLDVHPDSPAAKAGLGPGDVIRAVDGVAVRSREELEEAMEPWAFEAELEVWNVFDARTRTVRVDGKIPPLGVVLVPDSNQAIYMDLNAGPRWRRAVSAWGKRWFGRFARRT